MAEEMSTAVEGETKAEAYIRIGKEIAAIVAGHVLLLAARGGCNGRRYIDVVDVNSTTSRASVAGGVPECGKKNELQEEEPSW